MTQLPCIQGRTNLQRASLQRRDLQAAGVEREESIYSEEEEGEVRDHSGGHGSDDDEHSHSFQGVDGYLSDRDRERRTGDASSGEDSVSGDDRGSVDDEDEDEKEGEEKEEEVQGRAWFSMSMLGN